MLVSIYVPSQISWTWYIRAIHDSKNATTRVRVDPKQGQKEYFTAKRLTFDELILELLVYFAAIGVDGRLGAQTLDRQSNDVWPVAHAFGRRRSGQTRAGNTAFKDGTPMKERSAATLAAKLMANMRCAPSRQTY